MTTDAPTRRRDQLTFKGNLAATRYGWLRLTPAYSVHLVNELLDAIDDDDPLVLDPFCGTGTTALACAERGIPCLTTDINPFLLWLTRAKTRSYAPDELTRFRARAAEVGRAMTRGGPPPWLPPLHRIERWWGGSTLAALGWAMAAIEETPEPLEGAVDLLKLAFCRTLIARARVSFAHQSMSFRPSGGEESSSEEAAGLVVACWEEAVSSLAASAASPIRAAPRVLECDARALGATLGRECCSTVITSPPYPNRMSYVRELRPYLYWLGYLREPGDAGELDWRAIGGTWGRATSNVARWTPAGSAAIPYPGLAELLARIAGRSDLLARYVHKYVVDMATHVAELTDVVRRGGAVHYVVGNAKFYDTVVPVEAILAALLEAAGFTDVEARAIRKRSSKRELVEYLVSGRRG